MNTKEGFVDDSSQREMIKRIHDSIVHIQIVFVGAYVMVTIGVSMIIIMRAQLR